jgi:hypothetical protein
MPAYHQPYNSKSLLHWTYLQCGHIYFSSLEEYILEIVFVAQIDLLLRLD